MRARKISFFEIHVKYAFYWKIVGMDKMYSLDKTVISLMIDLYNWLIILSCEEFGVD